jgi:hypothetical protein
LKARIAGLLIAWLGLFLPWRHWSADAGSGTVNGFAESRPFWIVLGAVTLLVFLARKRERRWAAVALAVGGLALVAIAAREIAGYLADASALVSVGPGAGALLSLAGAGLLLAAALREPAPRRRELAGALTAVVLVVAVAALWPVGDGRPGAGGIADAAEHGAGSLAFHDGTLYTLEDMLITTNPRPARSYDAYELSHTGWFEDLADGQARDLTYVGDDAYMILGNRDQVGAIDPDGKTRLEAQGAHAEALAPAPDDGVYLLTPDGVSVLRSGRVTTVAQLDLVRPSDIASDPEGRVYVADAGNGRVLRVDPGGKVTTIVGTDAAPGCVGDGGDDPLALDVHSCTGVRALAADGDGNVYLALRGVAMVVGVTPRGRMGVVAGTGPAGWSDGGGRAVQAHLGEVAALAVDDDGDLYIGEDYPVEHVRRVADPAGLLDDPRPEPARPRTTGGCGAIARVREAFLRGSSPTEMDDAVAALGRAAPDAIRDRVDVFTAHYDRHRNDLDRADSLSWYHNPYRATIADYAENECGLIGGYDVSVEDVNPFCVAYRRFVDTNRFLPKPGEKPSPEWAAVLDAVPPMLESADSPVVADFASAVCVAE